MNSDAEELAVLYAEFDRMFAELERLIWRIKMLEEEETNPPPKSSDRSTEGPPDRRCCEQKNNGLG